MVLFANGKVGVQVLNHLIKVDDRPTLCVFHEPEEQRCGKELLKSARTAQIDSITVNQLSPERLKQISPTLGVSAYFGKIFKSDILNCFPQGILNLHPSFLPYNKGKNSNVWPLVDGTPAGVTIHRLDESIDTGPILVQRRIDMHAFDTAETLYHRLEKHMFLLFKDHWKDLKNNTIDIQPQHAKGTHHWGKELNQLKALDLDESMTMGDAINRLRACTFRPHPGARFSYQGRSYEVRIEISEVDPCE